MDARVKPAHDEVVFRYGPGSAAHHAAKSGALRSIRGTHRAFLFGNAARGHRSFTIPL
jgi:hypothetical protein